MANILMEGFEAGTATVLDLSQGGGGSAIRNATQSPLPATPVSKFFYFSQVSNYAKSLKNGAVEVYLHARFNTTLNQDLFLFEDPTGHVHARVNYDGTGKIQIRDQANATVATGTTVLGVSTWHLIEVHLRIGNATGSAGTWGLMEVRLDGSTTNEVAATNIDTLHNSATSSQVDLIHWGGASWDDLIVNDTAGAVDNSWVGDRTIAGLFPNGQGLQEQWDPPAATATRWYFPDPSGTNVVLADGTLKPTGSSGYTSPVTVSPDSLWDILAADNGNAYQKGILSPYRKGTSIQSKSIGNYSWTANQDVLYGQFISEPVAAQTISGNVHMQLQTRERQAANDARSQLVIRVVSQDGSTVRGTLYAGDTGALTDEWPTSTQNVTFPQDTISPVTMSSVVALEGDRIVVEFGFRGHATQSVQDLMQPVIGDGGSSGDLPDSEADTQSALTYNPWIEFSNAITLSDNGNWELVDEAAPDDDGTYIRTSTTNDEDLYALANVPSGYTMGGAIKIASRVKKVDAGSRTLEHSYRTSGGTQHSADRGLATSYVYVETLLDVDATDAAAWDDTKVNSLNIGQKAT